MLPVKTKICKTCGKEYKYHLVDWCDQCQTQDKSKILDQKDRDNAYNIGRVQGVVKSYHNDLVRCADALAQIDEIVNPKPGYCEIGMSTCMCGWKGEYPLSGCPKCHKSFVS